jgi:hypothetical protein
VSVTQIPDWLRNEDATVKDVVLADGKCVVDQLDRVWCQSEEDGPVHELVLPQTHETISRFEPDPKRSACPEAIRVGNRVCEHFTDTVGLPACKAGAPPCPRWCTVTRTSDEATPCGLDGFAIVGVRDVGDHQYVVYVDGPQVWLGPRLEMAVEQLRGGMPAVIEHHRTESVDDFHRDMDFELTTVILCGLVDERPHCSSPIVQDWRFEEIVTAYDEDNYLEVISHEEIRYEANITATPAKVKIEVVAGKRHANSENERIAGTRVLPSGRYEPEELFDQPFVKLSE